MKDKEFLEALEEKPKIVPLSKINTDLDRFVTIEEIKSKLEEHQFGVAYYTILEEALLSGDFVLHNAGPPPTYRIVRQGQPCFMSMKQ